MGRGEVWGGSKSADVPSHCIFRDLSIDIHKGLPFGTLLTCNKSRIPRNAHARRQAVWKYDLTWFNSEDLDWERDTKGYTLWEKPELRCLFQEKML